MSNSSSSNPSRSLSVLRAAASQVAKEEAEVGIDGMIKAADEIANERGLSSPLRRSQSPMKLSIADDYGEHSSRSVPPRATTPHNAKPTESEHLSAEAQSEKDALSLLESMNIKPKMSATVGFAEDVEALLAHSEREIENPKLTDSVQNLNPNSKARPSSAKDSLARQRYKKRLAQEASRNTLASSTTSRELSLTSEPAEVALRLSLADDRPYSESIRRFFRTEVEETLFRSTFLIQHPHLRSTSSQDPNKKKSYSKMRRSSDRLSIPAAKGPSPRERHKDKSLQFLTFDDAKECTFRPHTRNKSKKSSGNSDDEAKEDPKFSFVSRQEAEERNRREELTFNQGKAVYDAKVDKKICPSCGAKQSYDEVREKRKLCPNCRVEYCIPLNWSKVSKSFWKKCNQFALRVQHHREEIIKTLEAEYLYTTKKIVGEDGKLVEVKVPRQQVLTPEQEQEFFERMELKLLLRNERLKAVEKEVYTDSCTFKPVVKQYKDSHRDSEDEAGSVYSDDEKNVVEAFLVRYEEDMDYRREKMPQKYLPTRSRSQKALNSEEKPFKV